MSEAMFDRRSWNRALGPALRVIGYFSAGLLVFFIAFYLLYFLGTLANSGGLVQTVFSVIGPIILVFYFILCIFKVLDEELSGR